MPEQEQMPSPPEEGKRLLHVGEQCNLNELSGPTILLTEPLKPEMTVLSRDPDEWRQIREKDASRLSQHPVILLTIRENASIASSHIPRLEALIEKNKDGNFTLVLQRQNTELEKYKHVKVDEKGHFIFSSDRQNAEPEHTSSKRERKQYLYRRLNTIGRFDLLSTDLEKMLYTWSSGANGVKAQVGSDIRSYTFGKKRSKIQVPLVDGMKMRIVEDMGSRTERRLADLEIHKNGQETMMKLTRGIEPDIVFPIPLEKGGGAVAGPSALKKSFENV